MLEERAKLKQAYQILLGGIFLLFLFTPVFYFFFSRLRAPTLSIITLFSGTGILVFSGLFLLYYQRWKVEKEKEELEELSRERGRMFRDEETGILVNELRLRQTERYTLPFLSLIIAFILSAGTIRIGRIFWGKYFTFTYTPLIPLFLIPFSILFFLFSRYLLGMSREKVWKNLRPAAVWVGMIAIFSFLSGVSVTLNHFRLIKVDTFLFYLFSLILLLTSLEIILNLISLFYRPRGAELRVPFDSRLLYLLSSPEEVFPSFAELIDYQFGFRITQTWFFQFIKRRIIPLILLQLFLFYLLTCVVIIRPYEMGFIEFLGRPVGKGKVFKPGIHFKFPYPIGKARIFPVGRIQEIRIGSRGEEGERILWTEKHFEEEYTWIIASREGVEIESFATVPVNFLSGVIIVYYRINPDELYSYAYLHREPEKLLQSIAYSQFLQLAINMDFFELMNVRRLYVAELLKKKIQKAADEHRLGVIIEKVTLENVHPPVEVALSFEKVVGALEKKEASILEAEAYRNKELTLAQYTASQLLKEAESYREVRTLLSQAEADQFLLRLKAFQKNPVIFRYRHYLKSLEESLKHPRKFVVLSPNVEKDVTILNLEETLSPEILTLGLEGEKGREK